MKQVWDPIQRQEAGTPAGLCAQFRAWAQLPEPWAGHGAPSEASCDQRCSRSQFVKFPCAHNCKQHLCMLIHDMMSVWRYVCRMLVAVVSASLNIFLAAWRWPGFCLSCPICIPILKAKESDRCCSVHWWCFSRREGHSCIFFSWEKKHVADLFSAITVNPYLR